MGRRTKFPAEALERVQGVAWQASKELAREGRPVTEKALKRRMGRLATGGGSSERQDIVNHWLGGYSRTTQREQLIQWGFLDPVARGTHHRRASAAVPSASLVTPDETSGVFAFYGRLASTSRGGRSWLEIESEGRLAFASEVLRIDHLSGNPRLGRMSPVGLQGLLDSMTVGTYRGDGLTPQQEIALLTYARAYGVIPWPNWSEGGDTLACRVSLSLGWPLYFRLESGLPARDRFSRVSSVRRWLTWFIPWLA
jgi:hypothetical protein